jgi:hypothetical protein
MRRIFGTLHLQRRCQLIPKRSGIDDQRQSAVPKMIKSLTAITIFALLGAAVIALPGFAPQVRADEVVALAKANRLAIHPAAGNCASQTWPNFESSCLRHVESGATVDEARLVTVRR